MRGGDSTGLRAYNERLMITAIRQAGALSKAGDRAHHRTQWSGRHGYRQLPARRRASRQARQSTRADRKAFTPIALNPEGAFSLGVKIGRRSVEVLLVDFGGDIVASRSTPYPAPLPDRTMALATGSAIELIASLKRGLRARIVGLGVAMPWVLHEWSDVLGLEREAIAAMARGRRRRRVRSRDRPVGVGVQRRYRGLCRGDDRRRPNRAEQCAVHLPRDLRGRRGGHRRPPLSGRTAQCGRPGLDADGRDRQ